MAEPKTRPTDASVADFLAAVENPKRRADGEAVCALLSEVSGEPPVMWGPSIIGFGTYKGPTGEWMVLGLSPRKPALVLYGLRGWNGLDEALARLGKVKTERGCLYISDLAKVDLAVLREIATQGMAATRAKYG